MLYVVLEVLPEKNKITAIPNIVLYDIFGMIDNVICKTKKRKNKVILNVVSCVWYD